MDTTTSICYVHPDLMLFLIICFCSRGQILASLGDTLSDDLPLCLPIFLDRLKNEITRLTAVKALILIAASPLRIDLSVLLNEAMPLLSTFLRKNHRGLKLSTLSCLDILIQNYGNAFLVVILIYLVNHLYILAKYLLGPLIHQVTFNYPIYFLQVCAIKCAYKLRK